MSAGFLGAGSGMKMRLQSVIKLSKQLINFWISLVPLASIHVIVWYFDPIEDLTGKISLSLLAVIMSLAYLLDGLSNNKERREVTWYIIWVAGLWVVVLAIVFGDSIDAPGLVINSASLIAAVPALWLYWKIAKDDKLLKVWIIPIVVLASLYLVPPFTSTGVNVDLILLPLPVVSYACVVWVFVTRWFLNRAKRLQGRAIWGHGMHSLTMFLLVMPLVALTMLAVNALQVDDVWVAVSGVIVGILFGSAVSEPFKRFLFELGDLSPKTNEGRGHEGN